MDIEDLSNGLWVRSFSTYMQEISSSARPKMASFDNKSSLEGCPHNPMKVKITILGFLFYS